MDMTTRRRAGKGIGAEKQLSRDDQRDGACSAWPRNAMDHGESRCGSWRETEVDRDDHPLHTTLQPGMERSPMACRAENVTP